MPAFGRWERDGTRPPRLPAPSLNFESNSRLQTPLVRGEAAVGAGSFFSEEPWCWGGCEPGMLRGCRMLLPARCPAQPAALAPPSRRAGPGFAPDQPPNGHLLMTGGARSLQQLMSLFVWHFAANCTTLFFPPVRLFYFYTFDSEHDNNNNRLTLANRLMWCIIHVKDKQLSLASHIIIRFLLMS